MFMSSSIYHTNKVLNNNTINYTLLYIDQFIIYVAIFLNYFYVSNYVQQFVYFHSFVNSVILYYLINLNYNEKTHGSYLTLPTCLHMLMHINTLTGYLSTNL